ncbi:MAG TPA: 3'-5' exonuclease, partial [Kofleriaceae bacterium]|nr:3'-5' exonuclease [Kofleriaceae bacterium]
CDLSELVVQLRRWIADESRVDDGDVQRAETDADAIRVLTIHKAKGLEAPYVFIYGGASSPPTVNVHTLREATGRALVVGTPEDAIQRRLDSEADAENQRLAYVALTRAQVRLYLPIYGDGVIAEKAAYGPIQRCLAPLVDGRNHNGLFQRIDVPIGGLDDRAPHAAALAGFEAPPPPEIAPLVELPADRRGLAMLSYTRLAHDLEVTVAPATDEIEAAEFDVDDSAGTVGPDDLPPGADSGLFLHDVLEIADLEVARQAPDAAAWHADRDVADQLATAARDRGVATRYLPHAARLIHATLTRPLGELPSMVDAAALAREVEFSYPIPAIPGATRGLVRGYIDALIAWDDELWVLDYKSDLLAGEHLVDAARRRVRERYAVQMRLYAIAADRMRGARRLAGLVFAFVRHDIVVPIRVGDELLAGWTSWLGSLGELS